MSAGQAQSARSAAAEQEFVIEREFDAPRALVWKAWTKAEHLAEWWGPRGCRIEVLKFDLRPGGVFHYAMRFSTGKPMYGKFVYREIAAPERLVFVNSFSDPEGGLTRAPFPQLQGNWPLEVLNHLSLTEADGRTALTLRGHPINATPAEIAAYVGMFDSMRQGFGGTFDALADYLAKAR
jgi:uncharacterized protein YndB with AHSA1/START domain